MISVFLLLYEAFKFIKIITKVDRQLISSLENAVAKFLSLKRIMVGLKRRNLSINLFGYENGLIYPVHVSDKEFEDFFEGFIVHNG